VPTPGPTPGPRPAPVAPITPAPVDNIFQWALIFEEGFEDGFGVFQDGGSDAKINTNRFHDGQAALLLRDDSKSSKVHTGDYGVSSYSELRVHFYYYASGLDPGEELILRYSSTSGASWSVARKFVMGTDFEDREWLEVFVELDATSFDKIRLQFRCKASTNKDKIWIDTVRFEGK
jgi:hypothetical protein